MEQKQLAPGNTVELSVPALPSMMLVIRLTTAAVLARSGITADAMDEMKLAVEEATNCLMQTSCISAVRCSFMRVSGGVSIRLRGVPDETADCTERQKREIAPDEVAVIRCILATMADDVTLTEENGSIREVELISRLPR